MTKKKQELKLEMPVKNCLGSFMSVDVKRSNVFVAMGYIMLVGFLTIGFFAFPIGITLCAILGVCYGCWKNDKPFVKWSVAVLIIGILLVLYTLYLIFSM